MDFDTFKEDLAKAVKDRLELIFDRKYSVETHTVEKNLEALTDYGQMNRKFSVSFILTIIIFLRKAGTKIRQKILRRK